MGHSFWHTRCVDTRDAIRLVKMSVSGVLIVLTQRRDELGLQG